MLTPKPRVGQRLPPGPRSNRHRPSPHPPSPHPSRAGHLPGPSGQGRGLLSGYLGSVRSKGKIDAATWDDLEEALIRADVGVGATDLLLDDLRTRVKNGEIAGPDALVDALKADLVHMLTIPTPRWPCPEPASRPEPVRGQRG